MKGLPDFQETPIAGLLKVSLDHRPDQRGWFEEIWHREKWSKSSLNWFTPIQQNGSFNNFAGSTRGFHAEPWNKLVTVVTGQAFCAWVDLRQEGAFGSAHYSLVSPGQAFFIPAGVANGYQAISDGTSYVYLVDGHWEPGASYLSLSLLDDELNIPWPISLDKAVISEKDRNNPTLSSLRDR